MPANRKDKAAPDPLGAYRAKRSLDRTPEPGARPAAPAPKAGGLFIVHMHAATRLHWDLRLEMEGVLKSWAVPKGPSANRADKRLAVHVEDHPLEYGDFEGIIPEGNYGAGAVIVWDRGVWVPLEDPFEGLKKGKLLFELKGYKLRGKWTLVKLKKGVKEWLLIKEKDAYVSETPYSDESVLSGMTVEELRAAKDRAAPLRKELEKLGAPQRPVRVEETELMLAETREQPFSKAGWLFELKLDGYRVRAAREDGEAKLISRKGHDMTAAFPEIARAVAALPYEGLILDGELVVLDDAGRPSFNRLQNRARLSRVPEIKRAAVETPATFYVFDLLAFEGYDVRPLPLVKRKAILAKLLPRAGALRYSDDFETKGEDLYEHVVQLGLEGIVAKKTDSPYRGGRSANWLKIRADRTDDFVVVGYSRPKGSRGGFGALHLAGYEDGKLVYAGRVGSGFTAQQLDEVSAELEGAVRDTPPCEGPPALLKDKENVGKRETRNGKRGGRTNHVSRFPCPVARGCLLEPRQGLLARREVHQGRPDRVLPRHLSLALAVSQGPARRADALSRRHRGQVLFPEGRARIHSRVAADRADVERGHAARHRLFRVRQPRVAALSRQHGDDPAARVGEPGVEH